MLVSPTSIYADCVHSITVAMLSAWKKNPRFFKHSPACTSTTGTTPVIGASTLPPAGNNHTVPHVSKIIGGEDRSCTERSRLQALASLCGSWRNWKYPDLFTPDCVTPAQVKGAFGQLSGLQSLVKGTWHFVSSSKSLISVLGRGNFHVFPTLSCTNKSL